MREPSSFDKGWKRPSWRRSLHRFLDALDRAKGPTIRRWLGERAWVALLDAAVSLQSDRRYLRRVILPAVRALDLQRILFVGTRRYTAGYGRYLAGTRTEFWTTDIDPDAARWGEPGRHVVCDARALDGCFAPHSFDLVMLNGVFGWGIDDPDGMEQALGAAHAVLKPGGFLLLGWNSDRIADPAGLANLRDLFAPTKLGGMPPRRTFPDVTHVYACFRAV